MNSKLTTKVKVTYDGCDVPIAEVTIKMTSDDRKIQRALENGVWDALTEMYDVDIDVEKE